MNSFRGTHVNTCLAINAHVLVNLGFFILQGDCRCGTFVHAGFASGALILVNNCYQTVHSTSIASEGQTSTHVWQSTHTSLSTLAFSFSKVIADVGHSFTQVSHPVHLLASTIATNIFTPSYMLTKRQKIGFDFTIKKKE